MASQLKLEWQPTFSEEPTKQNCVPLRGVLFKYYLGSMESCELIIGQMSDIPLVLGLAMLTQTEERAQSNLCWVQNDPSRQTLFIEGTGQERLIKFCRTDGTCNGGL